MIEFIFIIWLVVFFILLAVNLAEHSHWFGVFAGLWLLLLGLAIILTGVQIQQGMTINTTGTLQTINYTYTNLAPPFYPVSLQSTYSFVWGTIFICIAIFITYTNAEETF